MDVSRHRSELLKHPGDRRPGRRGRLHEGNQHVPAGADAERHPGGGRLLPPRGRGSPAVVHAAEPEPGADRPEWHERPVHLHWRPQAIPRLPRPPARLPRVGTMQPQCLSGKVWSWVAGVLARLVRVTREWRVRQTQLPCNWALRKGCAGRKIRLTKKLVAISPGGPPPRPGVMYRHKTTA